MNRAVRGIRQQISAIAAGVTAVVIALVLFAQLAVSLQSNLHKVTDQSAVLARLVGDNAAAAIVFQDPAAATETLATLARSPLVLLGVIEQLDAVDPAVADRAVPIERVGHPRRRHLIPVDPHRHVADLLVEGPRPGSTDRCDP